jgi:hypothetical protein
MKQSRLHGKWKPGAAWSVAFVGVIILFPIATFHLKQTVGDPTLPLEALSGLHDPTRDPRPGTSAKDWKDAEHRQIFGGSQRERILVVAMGECQACSIQPFVPGQEKPGAFSKVVMIFPGKVSGSNLKLYDGHGSKYVLMPDENRSITDWLNASWSPRFFIFDGVGRLLKSQVSLDQRTDYLARSRAN